MRSGLADSRSSAFATRLCSCTTLPHLHTLQRLSISLLYLLVSTVCWRLAPHLILRLGHNSINPCVHMLWLPHVCSKRPEAKVVIAGGGLINESSHATAVTMWRLASAQLQHTTTDYFKQDAHKLQCKPDTTW